MSPAFSISYGREFVNSFYIGTSIENVLYGIELLLYFKTMKILLTNRGAHNKSNLFYALFSSVMMFMITIWVVTEAIFGQKMSYSDFPGGPYAYWEANITVWYMGWSRIGVIVLQLMTDGLKIHRCRIIWNSSYAIILPIILWLATLALGIIVLWLNSLPTCNNLCTPITLGYWCISVFLNTTSTCMICYRVMRHGWTIWQCLGKQYASPYLNIVTVIIESMLPYTLSGVALLVSRGLGSPTYVGFICVYLLMMSISSQMLILRVLSGKAWNNETFSRPHSSIKFNQSSQDTSVPGRLGDNGAKIHLQARTLPSILIVDVPAPAKVTFMEV